MDEQVDSQIQNIKATSEDRILKVKHKKLKLLRFLFDSNYFETNQTSLNLISKETDSGKFKSYLKFLFLPGYRNPKIDVREREILRTKTQRSVFRKMLTPLSILGTSIIIIMVGIAIFAPWLSPYSYKDLALEIFTGSFEAPSPEHLLGTTKFGRDVLGRLLYGTRQSLTIGIAAVLISYIFGTIFGLISAYLGGWVDSILMRLFDLMMTLPGLIFAMVFAAIFGRNMQTFLIAFGILGIPRNARLIRSAVLQVKENLYIEAAKTTGAKNFRIMFKHVLPNAITPMIINASFAIGGYILGISALTFLGLGEPNVVEWGWDINQGRGLNSAPWAFLWPGFFIVVTVLGFTLIGDGLRDAFDPRQSSKK